MRIRKRLALAVPTPPPPLSDLHLRQSEAAPPSHLPSDQNKRWALPQNEENSNQKEFGNVYAITNHDIREIVSMCDGGGGINTNLHPSSSFSLQESCSGEEDYKLIPLKKRKGIFDRNPTDETARLLMKSKTNKKCGEISAFDRKPVIGEDGAAAKKRRRGTAIMEGSRCSRVNGRGWRCCHQTLVGYSLCEHHLGKGRLRSMAAPPPPTTKKRSKVGGVKARSMSSLMAN